MTQDAPTPGEYATQHLLRVIRRPKSSSAFSNPFTSPAAKASHAKHRYDYQYPLGPEIHPATRAGQTHPLRGGMASLAAGAPGDRRGRIVKLDTPGAEAWRRQAAFQDSDGDDEEEAGTTSSSPTAHRRQQRRRLEDTEERATAGDEDEGDDDLDDDDDSDLGQPLGSTTPTLTTPSGQPRPQMLAGAGPGTGFATHPSERWKQHVRRGTEEEDEDEEDYGQPVERTITTSPLPLPNRV